jgi:hypothetical protein
MPDFLIIGAQKAGTSSLFNYLHDHPNVSGSRPKEVHYYDANFDKGQSWYRMHFPRAPLHRLLGRAEGGGLVTGEATPYYLFHPHVPKRVATDLPNAKLIILLRNPIDRAFSHYQHTLRHPGAETLSFSEAIAREEERTKDEFERVVANEYASSDPLRQLSYKSRGHYAEQIKRWLEHFDRSQLLVIGSEKFFQDTREEYLKVLRFLGLPERLPENFKKIHAGGYKESMEPKARAYLEEYFEPYNEELYELLDTDFGW